MAIDLVLDPSVHSPPNQVNLCWVGRKQTHVSEFKKKKKVNHVYVTQFIMRGPFE